MGRPKQQESITTFAEVINPSNSYPHQSNRMNNNDNRLMIYFQGLKLYIPDDFQPDTLLKLLQTMKRFAEDADHIFLACGATDFRKQILGEYYGAAEPPVRCGESHLSGLTEPPQFVY